jgi:hypothetical protein
MSLEQVENQDIKMAKTEGGTISRHILVPGTISFHRGGEILALGIGNLTAVEDGDDLALLHGVAEAFRGRRRGGVHQDVP